MGFIAPLLPTTSSPYMQPDASTSLYGDPLLELKSTYNIKHGDMDARYSKRAALKTIMRLIQLALYIFWFKGRRLEHALNLTNE